MYSERLTTSSIRTIQPWARPAWRNAKWPISAKVICGLLIPADALAIILSAILAFEIRSPDLPPSFIGDYIAVIAFGTLLAMNLFYVSGLYKRDILRRPRTALWRVGLCWLAVAAMLMAVGFLTKTSEDYSRLWSVMWFGFGLAALIGLRIALFARTAQWFSGGRLNNKIAVVGNGTFAQRTAIHFASHTDKGVGFVGIFTDEDTSETKQGHFDDCDGDLDRLVDHIRAERVDTVVIALPRGSQQRLNRIVERLSETPVDVRLCPSQEALRLLDHDVTYYAGLPTIDIIDRPLADWRQTAKEAEDRVLGVMITALILPVMALIALAIKLDSPGPVLFRQKRFGFNNDLIDVFKFRTMYTECTDPRGDQLTRRNDPRVTRVGAFLRKTSLDELPQFFNVLRGDMSIVGPRPHAVASKAAGCLYQDAAPHYDARHRVKPGITGWAQINGWRGPTETLTQIQKRVEHDLYYIENWSIWLDLKIIVLTIFKGFHSKYAF